MGSLSELAAYLVQAVRSPLTREAAEALRAQLHPHFLFNALHAVVQLIPLDPARAEEAAELCASIAELVRREARDR